ncbi:MAG: uncharacterized protein KVP18_000765 [Porospora cf. gigantea A]|nr:MAG: hypothetical protein KVP18_000765 [Porospora cf. gigantea A]
MFPSPWSVRALPYETAAPAVAGDCSLEQHSVFVFRYAYGSPALEHEQTGGLLTSALVAAACNLAQDGGVDGASWSDWANTTRVSLSETPSPSVGEYLDVRLELAFAAGPHALRILSHEPADTGRPVWTAGLTSCIIPKRRSAPVTLTFTTFRVNSLQHIPCPTGRLQVRVVVRGDTVARTCWRPVRSTTCGYTCEWSEDLSVPATPSTVRLEVHSNRCLGVTKPFLVTNERSLVSVFTTDGTNASFGLLSLSTSTQSMEKTLTASGPKQPVAVRTLAVVEKPPAVVVPIPERQPQSLRHVQFKERAPATSKKRVQFEERPTPLVSEASTETSVAPRLSQCSKCGGKFIEEHTCATCLEWACILCGCTSCTETSN